VLFVSILERGKLAPFFPELPRSLNYSNFLFPLLSVSLFPPPLKPEVPKLCVTPKDSFYLPTTHAVLFPSPLLRFLPCPTVLSRCHALNFPLFPINYDDSTPKLRADLRSLPPSPSDLSSIMEWSPAEQITITFYMIRALFILASSNPWS